jgi:CDP-diacylglycerol--glycerol-3-phosphate 3-phosphatidyltransferase
MSPESKKVPRFRPLKQEITDLPNLITLARIAMIPLILIWIDNYSRELSVLSASIFLIAALSDLLDGYLARRMGLVTVVGAFLDPLADKLIVLSTLVMLVARGRAPAWLVILLMARELAVTGLRAIASDRGFVIAAGAGGKAKSALQMTGIVFLLIYFPHKMLFFDVTVDFHKMGLFLVYLSLVMSLLSAFEYFWFFAEAAQKQAEELEKEGITRGAIRERLKAERSARRERPRQRGLWRLRRDKSRSRRRWIRRDKNKKPDKDDET